MSSVKPSYAHEPTSNAELLFKMMPTRYRFHALVIVSGALVACSTPSTRTPERVPDVPPADVLSVPEPTPRPMPRAKLGNPPFYDVLGKRYFVLDSADGFVERGVASWYGPGFHKENTSTGDPYDMYAMTAAHKTLPLPVYARVTNLSNGRSVIVYINDRGPFKDGRIVDLSYTAAAKLDMLRAGTALVELEVLTGNAPAHGAQAATEKLFVQAGVFGQAENAERLASRLRDAGYRDAHIQGFEQGNRKMHRVRIGPVATVDDFDKAVAKLKSMGINDARLAAD
jgi:rare lipoprotein A